MIVDSRATTARPPATASATSGAWLLRERTGESASTRSLHLPGATLAEAARLVEVDLEAPLDVGHDALLAAEDPHATAVAFLQRGVELLAAG